MKPLKRYYFWQYLHFKKEWRQLGNMSGYSTYNKCKQDNKFEMKQEYPFVILEAKPI